MDTLIESLRAAFYKRGVPHSLYVDNVIVYYKGQRMGEARPLDMQANDRRPSPPATARQANPSTLKSEPSTEI